jgi:signal transduction histidine kinase
MNDSAAIDRLSPLIESAATVVGETDLSRLLKRLVTEAMNSTGARYAALGIIGEHGALSDFLFEGIDPELAEEIGHLPTGKGVLGTVIRENQPLILESISDHPDSFGFPEHHPPMETFLGVPVSVGDSAFGNLYLTEKTSGPFDKEDQRIVEALGRIAGSAVQTARLQERLRMVAVVEDRQRIARDLHDSVIQDLFAVGLGLQGLTQRVDDTDTARMINDAVDRLDSSVNSLRRYIFELKDTSHPVIDLDDRLQDLVSRMGSAYPSAVKLSIEWMGKTEADDEIVMLVQEALSNALRHAGADRIEVTMTDDAHEVVLAVDDDGIGFEASDAAAGMGIANMRSRVERLGGVMNVDSTPGEGTSVEIRLPVKRPEGPS